MCVQCVGCYYGMLSSLQINQDIQIKWSYSVNKMADIIKETPMEKREIIFTVQAEGYEVKRYVNNIISIIKHCTPFTVPCDKQLSINDDIYLKCNKVKRKQGTSNMNAFSKCRNICKKSDKMQRVPLYVLLYFPYPSPVTKET